MSKKLIAAIAVVLLVTCAVAALHLQSQETVSCMVIRTADGEYPVGFEDLDAYAFSGSLVNGKGERSEHTYTGILMKELLDKKGIAVSDTDTIAVTSADNYTVEFTAAEVGENATVYIAVTVDGEAIEGIENGTEGLQIIVFGDENSRRCVRYASIIAVGLDSR